MSLALLTAAISWLGVPQAAYAGKCAGSQPRCPTCWTLAPNCTTDQPNWHCQEAPAGGSCNDNNACTVNDACDGSGNCSGTPISCPQPGNATASCSTSSGCSFTCKAGYQVSGSSCALIVANAGITVAAAATAGTTITASVPDQSNVSATYSWSVTGGAIAAGQNSHAISITAGAVGTLTVRVTVTTVASSVASSTSNVTLYAAPSAAVTVTARVTQGQGYSASVAAQSGASYAWSISNGQITSSTTGSAVSFTAGVPGTVTLGCAVTNGAGATVAGGASAQVLAIPSTTISAPSVVTAGTSAVATVPSQSGMTYAWSSSGGTITSGAATSSATFTAGAGPTVTLSATVTNAEPRSFASVPVTVNVVAAPSSAISLSAASLTVGDSVTASVPAQAGMTFNWSVSGAGSIVSGQGTNAITLTAGPSAGSLAISATVSNAAGTQSTSTVTPTVFAVPVATVTAPAAVTAGATGLTASVPAQPSSTYSWSISGGTITSGAAANAVTFTAGASGQVQLTATVSSGAGASRTASAVSAIFPQASCAISAPLAVTAGATSLAANAPAQSGVSFAWSIDGGTINSGAAANAFVFTAGAGPTLTLHCSATNGAGAMVTSSDTITVAPAPNATLTAPSAVTEGLLYNASVPPQAGSFQWTVTGVGVSASITQGAGTNAISFQAGAASGPGTLQIGVTVTNQAGTSTSQSATVSAFTAAGPPITAASVVTAGSAGLTASVALGAGNPSYAWTVSGGTITSGGTSSTVTYTAGTSGVVTLGCTESYASGGSFAGSASVQVAPSPLTPVVAAPAEVTTGDDGWTASVSARPGMTYVWSVTGGAISSAGGASGLLNGGVNSITFLATAPAGSSVAISCTEVNAAGAISTAGLASSAVIAAPVDPMITAAAPVTSGGSGFTASVQAHAGMTYAWTIAGGSITSPGSYSGQSIGSLNVITFSVAAAAGSVVTLSCSEVNAAGTHSDYVVTLSVVAPPPVQPVVSAPTLVTSGAAGIVASVPARAAMTYSWSISGGQLTNAGGSAGTLAGGLNQIAFTVTGAAGGTVSLSCSEINAAGTASAAGVASPAIVNAPSTPVITAPSFAAVNASALQASVPARSGMTYAWSVDGISTSAGASLASAAGALVGSTNVVTFSAGGAGGLVLNCVETNSAGVSGGVAVSTPITIGMPAIADQVVQPLAVPAQGNVGTLPGAPAVEGGAASYHIPIEVPPGRLGMQPQLALEYSSRNGNGIAGVGWTLSASRSIYRCPNIIDTEGANRPVMNDAFDKLCFSGQRLVTVPNSAPYGTVGSEYRTEIEQYEKIVLTVADATGWNSRFEVVEKSGRRSQYEAYLGSGSRWIPSTWYLMREFDPQGNCINYTYAPKASRTTPTSIDNEWVLDTIQYTGTGSGATCTTDATARTVKFNYTPDRPDMRTTYRYGAASPMTARLQSVVTSVPGKTVRTYQLAYQTSSATGRSLLQSVSLSASDVSLPPTTFKYQGDPSPTDPNYNPPRFAPAKLVQANVPSMAGAAAQLQTLGGNWQMFLAADFDGDGTRDVFFFNPPSVYLYLSSCNVTVPVDTSAFALGSTFAMANFGNFAAQSTFFGDGKAMLMGIQSGLLAVAPLNCAAGIDAAHIVNTGFTMGSTLYGTALDLNGDGLSDLMYVDSSGNTGLALGARTTNNALHWTLAGANTLSGLTPPTATDQTPAWTLPFTTETWMDLNGDGTQDMFYDNSKASSGNEPQVQLLGRDSPVLASKGIFGPNIHLSGLGGPSNPFAAAPNRRWIDVNGDGLPDIYDYDSIYLNMGGPGSVPLFTKVQLNTSAQAPIDPVLRGPYAVVMDIDGDGIPELLVPSYRTVPWCGGVKNSQLPNGDPTVFCGDDFDQPNAAGYRSLDRSVFAWDAYKFVEWTDGSYALELYIPASSLNLQFPIQFTTSPGDYNGDGMQDMSYTLTGASVAGSPGSYNTNQAMGVYLTKSLQRAPDLLVQVTNGLGATAAWTHHPLSTPTTAGLNALDGCDIPSGQSYYSTAHDGSNSPGYSYFTSSMWAVSSLQTSNGVGGMNRTCYRYQDAMLSDWGRGFQGFKVIVAEEQLPLSATGTEAGAGYAGCGGTCSPNNLATTTLFHQEFPLTSKPLRTTVSLASNSSVILSDTTHWWHQSLLQSSPEQWLVYSTGTYTKTYEIAGQGTTVATQTSAITELDPASGEPARSCVMAQDATQVSLGAVSSVLKLENATYDPPDTTFWWLGRLNRRDSFAELWSGTSPLLAASNAYSVANCASSVTGTDRTSAWQKATACQALPPTCPATPQAGAANVQSHSSTYQWVTSATDGGFRKLQEQDLLVNGTTESQTLYTYQSSPANVVGQLKTIEVKARNVSPVATPASLADQTVSSLGLTTIVAYSADGYFPAQSSNPLGYQSTSTFQPETGQPLCSTDIQGGPATCRSYDGLGRLTETTHSGTVPVEMRLLACTAANGPSCAIRQQSFQPGAPVTTQYIDNLGRMTGSGMEAFQAQSNNYYGNSVEIITKVDYNERGAKTAEYPPFQTSFALGSWDGATASPYATRYTGLDPLRRFTTKTVHRDVSLFEPGQGDADLTTTYAYAIAPLGAQTTINVCRASALGGCNSALTMSRTYDRTGKLAETTQNSTPGHPITTDYFYDASGNLTTIADSKGNTLSATYDDLGRKISVQDPDRHQWTYSWDGLSRLRTQHDARGRSTGGAGVMNAFVYDAIGRRTNRLVQGTNDSTPYIEATWLYDANQPGTLSQVSGVDGYQKSYTYDSLLRPVSVTTQIPADVWAGKSFTEQFAYDANFGRLKESSYPSGEFVAPIYDLRGHVVGEQQVLPDGTQGWTYRNVTSISARGAVTGQTLGNGVIESMLYDDATGVAKELKANSGETVPWQCTSVPGSIVRQTDYTYDQFLNLAKQTKQFYLRDSNGVIQPASPCPIKVSEAYQYDDLQRLANETRSYTNLTPASGLQENYAYDDLGNITSKSDYADSYAYNKTGFAGPHAVTSVSKSGQVMTVFQYDENGNMIASLGTDARVVSFDNHDRPVQISKGSVITVFRYSPDGDRYLQRTITSDGTSATVNKTVYYLDKSYELVKWDQQAFEEKTYIGGSTVVYQADQTPRQVRYLHLDRLGSVDAVSGTTPSRSYKIMMADAHGMDAFGKPRGEDWQPDGDKLYPGGAFGATTTRGFTGHEHLDDTQLIHMNGRVYDYRLGRFLSVDPVISNPASSQSLNPYSYIGNNPLSGVDPTGYEAECTGTHICQSTVFAGAKADNGENDTRSTPTSSPKNGAEGQQARQPTGNPTEKGGPNDVALDDKVGKVSTFGRKASGFVYGLVQAVAPGGALVPSPAPNDADFELGRGIALLFGSVVETAVAGGEAVGGAASILIAPATGPFAFVPAAAGVALEEGAVATGADALSKAYAGAKAIDNAMQMRQDSGSSADDSSGESGAGKTLYKRPSGATTPEQRASVQGKPCVDCGDVTPKQFADHKTPLVKEHYETGGIDKVRMRTTDAVQPQCPTCSAKQGADLSRYSRVQKQLIEGK